MILVYPTRNQRSDIDGNRENHTYQVGSEKKDIFRVILSCGEVKSLRCVYMADGFRPSPMGILG